MRLTPPQIETILAAIHSEAGAESRAILYGSRLDDQARGGDIDLLVECDHGLLPLQRAKLKIAIEARLGLPVDIQVLNRGAPPTAFQAIALSRGIEL